MADTAFTGRQLGEAVEVLEAMARDTSCFVVMTLAGAMTVAKQGLIVCDLIDKGLVNAVVSTARSWPMAWSKPPDASITATIRG